MADWKEPEPEDLKFTMAFAGVDEAEARKRHLRHYMDRRGVFCTKCGYIFEDGEVVFRRRRIPRPEFGDPEREHFPRYCRGCVAEWHPSWLKSAKEPIPCAGGCGVLVTDWYEDRFLGRGRGFARAVSTCSKHCGEQGYNARRRKSAPTSCAGCGETFTPARSDARYCSGACRQRAYRQRNGGSS